MSQQDNNAPEIENAPGVEPPDDRGPFEGNSIRLAVTREINVAQLQSEIGQRVHSAVEIALVVDEVSHIATRERPATLFVSPGTISERVVQSVIDNHVAKRVGPPQTGSAPQESPSGFNVKTLSPDAQELVKKLAEGKVLKTSESSDLLRAILGIEIQS